MNKEIKNNFTDLEKIKLKKFGDAPNDIQDKIEQNINIFKTIGNTIDLYTEKFIKTFIKLNE
jgi:hypothetical protein